MKNFTKSLLIKGVLLISLAFVLNLTNAMEINQYKGIGGLHELSDQEIMRLLDQLLVEEEEVRPSGRHGPIVQQVDPTAGSDPGIPVAAETERPLSPAELKWQVNLEAVRAYLSDKRAAQDAIINGSKYKQNGTNMFNYTFQDYALYDDIRLFGHAFLYGANSTNYASNSTNCFNNLLNLA